MKIRLLELLPALADDFLPDIISTDLSPKTLYREPVVSLPRLLSKFMAMGMTLTQVIDRATLMPARSLGVEGSLATLAPGTIADVAIFRNVSRTVAFADYLGDTIHGSEVLVPQMTIKGGGVKFSAADFDQIFPV